MAKPDRIETLRQPPHSLDAEESVLGGLMLDERALAKVSDWISEEDFYRKDHRLIFRAILDLAEQGKPYDAVTMAEWFEANVPGELFGDGERGETYALKIANAVPSAANVAAYAEIVKEKSRLRQMIDIGTDLVAASFTPNGSDTSRIASTAQGRLGHLIGDPRGGGLVSSKTALPSFWAKLQDRFQKHEHITGVASPFMDLDEITLGWQPGDLIIIAGRPSMGKSILGEQCATFNAIRGNNTALFSLEMKTEAIIQRQVARLARVPHKALRSPRDISEEEWQRISDVTVNVLQKASLYIDDQARLTPKQIVARAKRQHMRNALTLIVVDHLHEIGLPGKDRVNELGDAARELRTLGRELNVPVILLVQLNRSNVTRQDHRPTLGDLRGSGAIEEVADVALLIHRDDYYKQHHNERRVELILAKGRDLPTGKPVYLENHFEYMRLESWSGNFAQDQEDRKPIARKGLSKPALVFDGTAERA